MKFIIVCKYDMEKKGKIPDLRPKKIKLVLFTLSDHLFRLKPNRQLTKFFIYYLNAGVRTFM